MQSPSGTKRLILPLTLSRPVRRAALSYARKHRLPRTDSPVIDVTPVHRLEEGDLVVHGFPDLFGRLQRPPVVAGLLVREPVARPLVSIGPGCAVLDLPGLHPDPALVAGALVEIEGRIRQMRGVKPLFPRMPPLALPVLAPGGLDVPPPAVADPEDFPGLPDLVVVRVPNPPQEGPRVAVPPVVVACTPPDTQEHP